MTSLPSSMPSTFGAIDLSALAQPTKQHAEEILPQSAILIDEENFETEILTRSLRMLVVVLLWSPRSDSCIQLANTLATVVNETHEQCALAMINVDTTPQLGQLFGIDAVPTVIAFAGGQPVTSFQGLQPHNQLTRWIHSLLAAIEGKLPQASESLTSQTDPVLAQASACLERGDFVAARNLYHSFIQEHPDDKEAKTALKKIDFLQRATMHSLEAVNTADTNPYDIEAVCAAADIQILNHDLQGAFSRLLGCMKLVSGQQQTIVRNRLVELFDIFDLDEPDVVTARRSLANFLH